MPKSKMGEPFGTVWDKIFMGRDMRQSYPVHRRSPTQTASAPPIVQRTAPHVTGQALVRCAKLSDAGPGERAHHHDLRDCPMNNSDRIIRLKTVLARTGLSRTTLYRKIGEGTFPRQVKISVHGAGWYESSVNHWIADPVGYREDSAGSARQ